jgi:hypothetical protein
MAAQADCHTARGPGLSERPAGGVAARRRDRPGLRPGPGRRREGQPGLRPPTAQQSRGLPGLGWPGGPGLPDSDSPVSVRVSVRLGNFVVCRNFVVYNNQSRFRKVIRV